MAAKSANPGRKRGPHFNTSEAPSILDHEQAQMASAAQGVSMSLKYYRQDVQCFSEWTPSELKKFSSTIEALSKLNSFELRTHAKLCTRHKYAPQYERYRKPRILAKDAEMFELRLGSKARVHGIIVGSIFHLVWLDRNHEVFKSPV